MPRAYAALDGAAEAAPFQMRFYEVASELVNMSSKSDQCQFCAKAKGHEDCLRALGRQRAKTVGLGFTKATTFDRNCFFRQFCGRAFERPLPPQRINCRIHQKLQKEGCNNPTHHGRRNALHDF